MPYVPAPAEDLTDVQCLALYEAGAARHPIDRALLLAASSDAARDPDAWADVPLGERDAHLMALRCRWFGPRFDAAATCPACRQWLGLTLDLRSLVPGTRSVGPADVVRAAGARFRRPTSRDLAAIADQTEIDGAARALLQRLSLDGEPAGGWRDEDHSAIDQALDEADPLAHVTVAARCDGCGHRWVEALDIAASLWDELADRALGAVREVHVLASAYGWSEQAILSMPAPRRALYLRQVAG